MMTSEARTINLFTTVIFTSHNKLACLSPSLLHLAIAFKYWSRVLSKLLYIAMTSKS